MNNFEVINIIDYGNSNQNYHEDISSSSNYFRTGTVYYNVEATAEKETINFPEIILSK
jgi:hypothetical protein